MDVSATQNLPPAAPAVESGAASVQTSHSAGMAKLQKAAQDFEAIMINSLWSEMKEGSLGSDDGDDLSDSGGGSLEQVGMQMVSEAMAKAGGIGIGKMIVHALQSKV